MRVRRAARKIFHSETCWRSLRAISRSEASGTRCDSSMVCIVPLLGRGTFHRPQRIAFPPAGFPRFSSIVTGAFSPSGARSDGHNAIADASESHDARTARFSERLRVG
jgi:hypothetical protein